MALALTADPGVAEDIVRKGVARLRREALEAEVRTLDKEMAAARKF